MCPLYYKPSWTFHSFHKNHFLFSITVYIHHPLPFFLLLVSPLHPSLSLPLPSLSPSLSLPLPSLSPSLSHFTPVHLVSLQAQSNMIDLIQEYQQYQEATVEEGDDVEEDEAGEEYNEEEEPADEET